MYLPTKYAPLLLSNHGRTLQEAWNSLIPALQANGMLDHSTAILNWFRCSFHATHVNNLGPPITAITLVSPFMDTALMTHRQTILHATLPAIKQGQEPG